MAQRGIREYDAKNLLARYLPEYLDDFSYKGNLALVGPETDIEELEAENQRLKKMYIEERLKAEIAREAIKKSGGAVST